MPQKYPTMKQSDGRTIPSRRSKAEAVTETAAARSRKAAALKPNVDAPFCVRNLSTDS